MKRLLLNLSYILLLCIAFACNGKQDKLFTSLSHKSTGIDFKNWISETESFNVLDYIYMYDGAGVAAGDINNDGLPDLFFSGNLTSSKLYLNKGKFRFEDITDKAFTSGTNSWNTGVTMADINGDGFLDIYVCSSADSRAARRKNLLFINNGNLTFTERAESYGIADTSYSFHSSFFDYDKDGDLDLFVMNHSFTSPSRSMLQQQNEISQKYENKLYKNTGGKFVDVSEEAGLVQFKVNYGLGIAVSDFNNDSWPDMYICNDYFEPDYLFINRKDGTFAEELDKYFDHISSASMGNDAADFNNDGFIDLITLDMLPEDNYEQKLVAAPDNFDKYLMLKNKVFRNQSTRNMLQVNNHGSYFTEIGQYAGVFSTNWSWASLFCDFDNDGNKDLYISNGCGKNTTNLDFTDFALDLVKKKQSGKSIIPKMTVIEKLPATILNNYIFKNNGDLTYTNATETWGDEMPSLSSGTAYADLDNDGDMDLVVSNINDYAFVYRNNTSEKKLNHFLKISLDGAGLNKSGIGARVEVFCKDKTYTQELIPSRGYMSSVSHELIFGIGQAAVIDSVKILWPDMREQVLTSVGTDQSIILHNNDAKAAKPLITPATQPLFVHLADKNILEFKHIENEYVDFAAQSLLPHFLSTQGPHIAGGDVNNDGLEDLFLGGARDTPGKLYFQKKDGSFELQKQVCFEADKSCEDGGVLFFDADGDKDPDLYVISGGNEFSAAAPELRDRLYINNGKGSFKGSPDHLPKMLSSGSCIKAADMDNDGDSDLFVGGRLIPGAYPLAPRSYILENNGKGFFTDVTEKYNKSLMNPGMVTDAVLTDFNGDKKTDLIIVGEWMGIRAFQNDGKSLEEITGKCGLNNSEGWWNTIIADDFDNDGDIDFVAGNLGLNSQVKATPDQPATIFTNDFDNNGIIDPVMCYYIQGKSYPLYGKDDLQKQIRFIKKKFTSYDSYARQTIADIFPPAEFKDAQILKAVQFATCYIENKGNSQFELRKLPPEAQFSPVYSITAGDFNSDGNKDIILAGNLYGTRLKFGEYDANKGLLLTGDGKGSFSALSDLQSGLHINGEVRDVSVVKLATGKNILIFALNNDSAKIYGLTGHP